MNKQIPDNVFYLSITGAAIALALFCYVQCVTTVGYISGLYESAAQNDNQSFQAMQTLICK